MGIKFYLKKTVVLGTVLVMATSAFSSTIITSTKVNAEAVFVVDQPCDFTYSYDSINNNRWHNDGYGSGGKAIDLNDECSGTDALASISGTITKQYSGEFYCNELNRNEINTEIIITASDGRRVKYLHLDFSSSNTKNTGDIVKVGDVIGKIGHEGCATGNHIHFEVRNASNQFMTYAQWKFGETVYPQNPGVTYPEHNDYNGDGISDILVVSGDPTLTRRRLHIGNSTSSPFQLTTACMGNTNNPCGISAGPASINPNSKFLNGDFDGDGDTEVFFISGETGNYRKTMYDWDSSDLLFNRICDDNANTESTCGFTFPDYLLIPTTKVIQGDFNGDSAQDLLIVRSNSGTDTPNRMVLLGNKAPLAAGFTKACGGTSVECGIGNNEAFGLVDSRYIAGNFNGDSQGKDSLIFISADINYPLRANYVWNNTTKKFEAACSGTGATDVCGGLLDNRGARSPKSRYIVGNFDGDIEGKDDILYIASGGSYIKRRLLIGNSNSTTGFTLGCDGADQTSVCGIPYANYLFDPSTRYVVGEFQNEEGAVGDDILIVSGDQTVTTRSVLIGKDNTGFVLKCSGNNDGVCGLDNSPYMRHLGTDYVVGDFNDDSKDDVAVISRDINQPRRRIYIGSDLVDGGFLTGCYGDNDGACGLDNNAYMFHANTRIL